MEKVLFALTSFLICFILTPAVIYFFVKNNIIDSPGGRKIHKINTPSMGGIPILIGVLFSILLWFTFGELNQSRSLLFGVIIMFLVGLRDDVVNLSALHKLVGQLAATTLVVVYGGIQITSLYGLFGVYDIPTLVSIPLSIFILIVITNSYNLIDGVDGLAGSVSLITLFFFGIWFTLNDMHLYANVAATFLGSIIGFMMYNWSPAKIFMGDTGALAIGLLLASFSILFLESNFHLPADSYLRFDGSIATAIALLILPIYDTSRIFIKRVLKGRSPLSPDKSHIHHFIIRMGMGHRQTTTFLIVINLGFIALAVLLKEFSDRLVLPVILSLAISLGLLLDYLALRVVKKNARNGPKILPEWKRASLNPQSHPVVEKSLIEADKILQN